MAEPAPAESGRFRARELGLCAGSSLPGRYNAITDVAGVLVGQTTLHRGEGVLRPGQGPVRTGVTAILPCADPWAHRMTASTFVLNGNGEMTGFVYTRDLGFVETPIMLTNTLNVGKVADATISWLLQKHPDMGVTDDVPIPVVAECDDSALNDIQGRHVGEAEVLAALREAHSGPVEEGCCGAGTGMMAYELKGGVGTSSRVTHEGYTVGVLVLANMGRREELMVRGVPVGKEIADVSFRRRSEGSIIFIVATDAPLNPSQLERLARHAGVGLGRTGTVTRHGSGEIGLAFSTADPVPRTQQGSFTRHALRDESLDPLYQATADATEEAILNAMLTAVTTDGRDGSVARALPLDRLKEVMARYGRPLLEPGRLR